MSPSIRSRRSAAPGSPGALGPSGAPAGAVDRSVTPGVLAGDRPSVSRLLYDRLEPAQIAEISARAAEAPELAGQPEIGQDAAERAWLVLNYGVWFELPAVLERTGLTAAQPPEEVHAMARGPLAAAGGLYEADMVFNAVRAAGAGLAQAGEVLDFGCSSGRVLRVLAAAFPTVRWRGCDPNERAIEWIGANLPRIEAFVSPQAPPLPIPEAALGAAFAISIWSHFAPELGLRWFDEMHRVIRPGGHLVFTTHGFQSVAHNAGGLRPVQQCVEIRDALYRDGFWYAPEFGTYGDAGVLNPEWGTAFLSPEWVLAKLCPQWHVIEYAVGRNGHNQDVYVLRRA